MRQDPKVGPSFSPLLQRARPRLTSTRLAALLLLLIWTGPVTLAQTDGCRVLTWMGAPGRAAADTRTIPAGEALLLEPGAVIQLHLRGGSTVVGRFLGRALLDSAVYATRFAERAAGSFPQPIALGETLMVAMRDGRVWTAPFAGYGERALLLRSSGGTAPLRVPFEFTSEIRLANGTEIAPKELAKAFRHGKLPSAEALVIGDRAEPRTDQEPPPGALRVPAENVLDVSAEVPGRDVPVAGAIILGVVVTAVIVVLVLQSQEHVNTYDSCGGSPTLFSIVEPGVRRTTRPFDLDRECFVGDTLVAVGDTAAAVGSSATAGALLGSTSSSYPVAVDTPTAR